MMQSKYKDKAIPLVSVDPVSGKYLLTPEATQFLKNVPAPIGVVSVAGLYRTGKSYLLNQMLLNRSSGFGVGPTINPCTKGLWCWGTPIKGETPEGEKMNIIVIDTEGIGALDEDQTHDTRIFTLAILSSSCFIYNSVGSIDENAVQNLSLVVNLTKHIQLRSEKSIDDEDPDKIASQLPMFYWVVRDFSLQISDSQGNKMTSKEYLERALAPQKGFSEDIEEKNRIRKLLTSFFKERECFTLVRPLIEESKLQDLDKMSFDDLRPEFVSQVINFRKRVTTRMKPKTMNGQRLNGELYLSMLNSYVGAINDGAVPNIENAWNYMCQEQCTKVMTECLQTYEGELREIKIPCSFEDMNRYIEAAEETVHDKFKKKSIGDDSEKYYKQLQTKMRERAKELKKINAEEGKSAFKKYIAPFAAGIQQKITREQYGSFEDFLDELKKLEERVTKEGPNYVDSNLNCQICLNKILSQGVTYFFKRMRNEREQIKKTLEERIKINENEVDSLKKERESEQFNVREKLTQLDREKVEMAFKLEKIQIQLDRATKEKTSEGELLSRNLTAKKQEVEQMRKDMEVKITQANARIEEMAKNLHTEQSNWEKEKAIYELKVRQQAEKIEDLEKKLQNSSAKMVMESSELAQKHRDQIQKFDEKINDLTKALNESKERNERYEERELEMKEKYSSLTEKFETVDRKLREETSSKNRQIERLKNEHESDILRVKNEMMQTKDDSEKVGREMEDRMKKQDSKAKELAEELKSVRNRYERENQVMAQELEFAKRGLEETKQKLTETKFIYEQRIAAIEADSGLQREQHVKREIEQIKAAHEDQLQTMDNEFRENRKNMINQIEYLTKDRNEFELKLKVAQEQLMNEKMEHEEIKNNLTEKYKNLENEMKAMQREKMSEMVSKEGFFNEKVAMLERDLEEMRENYHIQKSETEARTHEEITQIKNFYEMEREKMESRQSEQKDKLKKKYQAMVEEYEKKLQEETDYHEEEREKMESEYENELRALNLTCSDLTVEKEMLLREKANLEQRLASLTEKFTKMESDLNERLQKLIETSKSEKETMTKKLEELQHNKNEMQKEILSLTHERDQYRSQSFKQASELEELKSYNSNLSERFESTKLNLEERLKESQQRYMKEKSRFETEIALLQQKRDFAEQKIVEVEKDLKTTKEREQEQLKSIKERHEEDLASMILKATTEKKTYEEKIEKVKKQSAQSESNLIRQLSEISKAKAVDEQKIEYLDKKLTETQSKSSIEIQTLSDQLKAVRDKFTAEGTMLKARITELEEILHAKENELVDQKNNYEIKIALDDIKIKNLQQWGENNIGEKAEMIKNLERQLDDARKRNENDKSSQQLTHQEILTRMESKYRSEITQLNQDVTKRAQEIEYLTKEHDRIIKDLKEKLGMENQARMALETKAARIENDFMQKEMKLTMEIDKLRMEKDSQSKEMHTIINREKEICKNKIMDFEKKVTESDRQKTQAIFEKEKQEARWKMEKNSLEEKIEEYKQACEKEKNESKKLMKDNEKLKAEKKKNTSFIKNQTTIMTRDISAENKENSQYQ